MAKTQCSQCIKAKGNCEKTLVSLIKNPGTGKFSTWDPVKTSKCTTKPPKFEDKDTCTTNGCTTDVYYLDGEICGYSQQHLTSVEAKKPLQHVKKKKTRNPRQHGQHKQSQEINSQTAMNHCGFMRGEMWDLLKRGNLLCVRKTKKNF